ncbi:PH domain containing protein [Sporothrix brasiliensis 5110]|uniref:PH domain containing protein n=1 Tax=Sporothrix brasiliensis 5110 TaxID=1398154 RepID=A0A0C2ESA9_9PEZI|nr:PH domain containing protein [Sporothrix brasiliensis 5110]KIH89234.1 PH domain containing protein [Sporothrix brasiliensis 5110]
MVEMQTHAPVAPQASAKPSLPPLSEPAQAIPSSSQAIPIPQAPAQRSQPLTLDTYVSPVNQNGSFEFDRVIKTGYVQRRTQKTKTWRSIFLVLRPNILSIYKTDKEDKLRHKIFLSELTAVSFLRDPKHKRDHLFGLYSPSRNYYFQASSAKDAQEWVEAIRSEARIEEEEEEMFLASPLVRRQSYGFTNLFHATGNELSPYNPTHMNNHPDAVAEHERRMVSSSPEPQMPPPRRLSAQQIQQQQPRPQQHPYNQPESLAWSGNEMGLSDYSDGDAQNKLPGMSSESLTAQSPPSSMQPVHPVNEPRRSQTEIRNASQSSGLGTLETDPDRVIWQGWLWLLRSKGGVRQWKDSWAVLRPRNLILYKDETEYAAQLILPLSSIVNVVERDPLSRTKKHCLEIITEEKNYRFSAHDEDTLVRCLGAFKSLLTKRRGLEIRAAAAAAAAVSPSGPVVLPAGTLSSSPSGAGPFTPTSHIPSLTTPAPVPIST